MRSAEVDVLLGRNALFSQTLAPVRQGADGDRKRRGDGLTCASPTLRSAGPGEKGEDSAGSADVVAKVKVIGFRVVEVHGPLDEAQTQDLGIEVQVALRIGCDRGDVVQAYDRGSHAEFLSKVLRVNVGYLKTQRACAWREAKRTP